MDNLQGHVITALFIILSVVCSYSFSQVIDDGDARGIVSFGGANGGTRSALGTRRKVTPKDKVSATMQTTKILTKHKRPPKKEIVEENDSLSDFINQIDAGGLIRQELRRRRIHIPADSVLSLSSQVSRPNIFPNIFNQGDGFIVDAVIEWPIWLDLHLLAEALIEGEHYKPPAPTVSCMNSTRSGLEGEESHDEHVDDNAGEFSGKSLNPGGIVGFERCLIYEKIEAGMSITLDISRNHSHDCMLRAICEVQMIEEYYPDAPLSIMFEMIHLILTPSLGTKDVCYKDYLRAEQAAFNKPEHCSHYVSQCPLNVAALLVRNFFPAIL